MLRKLIILSALSILPASATGLVNFSLDLGTLVTPPGGISNGACDDGSLSCVIFTGNIAFTTDQDYILDDISIQMNPSNPDSGADVVGNDNYFQSNSPGLLGADGYQGVECGGNSCYNGGLFEIDIDPKTPLGDYYGTATLVATDLSGDPITGANTVVNFQVDVATPEPGMGSLMLVGLAALAAMGLRRRRTALVG